MAQDRTEEHARPGSSPRDLLVRVPGLERPGLAHGFLVTSESADFLYKTTDYYAPEHERCIAWDDPTLAIGWPLTGEPQLSAKDRQGKRLAEADLG